MYIMARIKGHLTLIGKLFDTKMVSERLQTQPTWEKHPTDVLNNGRLFGHTEWGVKTACFDSDDAKEMILSLTELIPVSTEEMKRAAEEQDAEWHILFSIDVEEDFPAVVLPPSFVCYAASINAAIGFDVFLS